MRKILILLIPFLLANTLASAQKYQEALLTGKKENGMSVKVAFTFPTGCGNPWWTRAIDSLLMMAGQYYDTCAKKYWLYDSKLKAWDTLHVGPVSTVPGWGLNGTAGTNPSTNLIGPTDSSGGWRAKIGGYEAFFIQQRAWDAYPYVPNAMSAFFGLHSGGKLTPLIVAGTSDGKGNIGYGPGTLGNLGSTANNRGYGPGLISTENTAVGQQTLWWLQNSNLITHTGRNVGIGNYVMWRAAAAGENTGGGAFNMEILNNGLKNAGWGSNWGRSMTDNSYNSGVGAYGLAYTTCVVGSVTVNSSSSDWTTASIAFPAPYPGTPGSCAITATGTVQISGGQIVGVTIINPGCGYNRDSTTYAPGFNNYPPSGVITGDGSSVSITTNILCGDGNSTLGHYANPNSRACKNGIYIGNEVATTARYWDEDIYLIGRFGDVSGSISPLTKVYSSVGIGRKVIIPGSKTFTLGAVRSDTNHFVQSYFHQDTAYVYGSVFMPDLPTGVGVKALRISSTGLISMTDTLPDASATLRGAINTGAQTIAGVKTFTGGGSNFTNTGHTAGNFFLVGSGNTAGYAFPNINNYSLGTAAVQYLMLKNQAPSSPVNSEILLSLGHNAANYNEFIWNFKYVGNNSLANVLEFQFYGFPNAARFYASGNWTIGPSVTVDNGYRIEAGGKVKFRDSTLIGDSAVTKGTLSLFGGTSGKATIVPAAVAADPVFTLPIVTGTIVQYSEGTTASSSTPTPQGDAKENYYDITALAANATVAAPTGTPRNHNTLVVRILDNGTPRTLAWNGIFRASSALALPSTTTTSKTLYIGFIYNSASNTWDLVSVLDNF